ncbi:hypothetical protein N7455_000226 [Penicillium solitum]|uniref:uncharacterized protein n=1 Tax=Penicillium solitum TaxID=60172 RepID=UPI0032C401A3|nr:hypothetical protein N7455_000226 [Penicillium solitum]
MSFLDSCSPDEVDFLAQLADLENCVDMSSFTWTPQDNPSIVGDHSLPQHSTGGWTYEIGGPEIAMNMGYLCPDNFRLPADYVLELEGSGTVPELGLKTAQYRNQMQNLFMGPYHPYSPNAVFIATKRPRNLKSFKP